MMMMMMNCFCEMVDRRKAFTTYFQLGPLSEILTIANLRHAASRVWTCTEIEFRLCWTKMRSSDNHSTTVPLENDESYFLETWRIILSGDIELNARSENPKKYPKDKPQRKPSQAATCETGNKTVRTSTKRLSYIYCKNETSFMQQFI